MSLTRTARLLGDETDAPAAACRVTLTVSLAPQRDAELRCCHCQDHATRQYLTVRTTR